jgi:hypothetical protein
LTAFEARAYLSDCAADDLREVLSLTHVMTLDDPIGLNAALGGALDIVEDNRDDGADNDELERLEEEVRQHKLNDPCLCGSGKKFNKCCGKGS